MKANPHAFLAVTGGLAPALAGASLAAGCSAVAGHAPMPTIAAMVLFALLALLAWTDARTKTVPDGLTFALIATGMIHTGITGAPLLPALLLTGLLTAFALGQDTLRQGRGWFGSGDYLMLAGALAWLGPRTLPDLIMLSAVALGLHAIIARQSQIAVAPSLTLAVAALWFAGDLTP